jgi:peroxisomal 3,2-trans-enoyl-CoA isomerase
MMRSSRVWLADGLRGCAGLTVVRAPANPKVVVMTLNRPKKKNALTGEMYTCLTQNFHSFSKDASVGAIVLTGAPESTLYCSGNDLGNFFAFGTPRALSHKARNMLYDFVQSFIECEKPIVAGISGPAIGIAVTTLLLCDVRLSVPDATFHTPFKALAQAPEGCSSYLFPKVLGAELARKMLVDGYTMKADEAHKHGFVNEIVVPRENLLARAVAVAGELAEGKNGVPYKRATLADRALLTEVNRHEADVLEDAWVSKECFAALADFMERKGQKAPAMAFRVLNATRPLWDRKPQRAEH